MRIRSLAAIVAAVVITAPSVGQTARAGQADTLVQGVTAYPGLVAHTQPDGRVFEARQFGDESYHWMETADGYTIQLNTKTGFFEYLRVDDKGHYERTGLIVGRDDPTAAGIAKHARESKSVIEQKRAQIDQMLRQGAGALPTREYYPNSGAIPILVILANFNDTTTSTELDDFRELFNAGEASVRDFYNEVSYGAVSLDKPPLPGGPGLLTVRCGRRWYPRTNRACSSGHG